jgi:hypothetical protein
MNVSEIPLGPLGPGSVLEGAGYPPGGEEQKSPHKGADGGGEEQAADVQLSPWSVAHLVPPVMSRNVGSGRRDERS